MDRVPEPLSEANRSVTPDRLAEIRARLAAATPGPWAVHSDPTFTPLRAVAIDGPYGWDVVAERISPNDADLMANAPTDLAYLLAEVDGARERIAILRAEVRDLEGIIGIASPHGHADPSGTSYQAAE